MGTRSVVKVEGNDFAQVYVHWDGYPEHMLPWLSAFNEEFTRERCGSCVERGGDPEYRFAQLLRFSERCATMYNLDASEFTGYGVVPYGADYGQDYEYTLKADGSVECFDFFTKERVA